jgi:ArsR family transcriptional regulator
VARPEAPLTGALKLFADPTRLRMMGLLEREELSVGELARALGMAQSRVSNHLRLLRDAGCIGERHAGSTTFLQLHAREASRNGDSGAGGTALIGRIWGSVRGELEHMPEHSADRVRLERVLADRAKEGDFFDRVAGFWDKIGVDFETGQARHRVAASLLPPGLVVADIGCGTGYFARSLMGVVGKLICVDRSQAMLDEAQQVLARAPGATQVEFRRGQLDALPIADGELDAVVAGMVLHHLPSLRDPLSEMRRVLKPGGVAAILELEPHPLRWTRERLGDHHLGLPAEHVIQALQHNGFVDLVHEPVDDHYQPTGPDGEPAHLPLYLVRARAGVANSQVKTT